MTSYLHLFRWIILRLIEVHIKLLYNGHINTTLHKVSQLLVPLSTLEFFSKFIELSVKKNDIPFRKDFSRYHNVSVSLPSLLGCELGSIKSGLGRCRGRFPLLRCHLQNISQTQEISTCYFRKNRKKKLKFSLGA